MPRSRRARPDPRYGRVFVPEGEAPQNAVVFLTDHEGTFAPLRGDLERERMFRLTQGLVPAQDLGVRLLCRDCPHAFVQHGERPVTHTSPAGPCLVPGCRCQLWEASDCACWYASGGNHRQPYRRWCWACRLRDPAAGYANLQAYDDSAAATQPGQPPTPLTPPG